MNAAMHKRTKVGCEKLVQDAINKCTVPSIQSYIKRNYMSNTQQWALWARQHSSLLLQVTSTNPLESYHSELKRSSSLKYGLIGIYNFLFFDHLLFVYFTHALHFYLLLFILFIYPYTFRSFIRSYSISIRPIHPFRFLFFLFINLIPVYNFSHL